MCLLNGSGKSNGFTSVSSNGRSVVDIMVLLVIRSYTISLIFLFQEALSLSTILIV